METIKLGYVHMPRGGDTMDCPYAYITERVWFAPWRWNVIACYYPSPRDTIIAYNVSAAEAKGLLKILGVYPHRQL